jgi:hypothetical protein
MTASIKLAASQTLDEARAMSTDVALAGFVFCADDWAEYDPDYRAELLAAAAAGRSAEEMARALRLWDSGPVDASRGEPSNGLPLC